MKILDLDHNCQELIASAMKTHGEIENYAIATHNNELLEQNLRNHIIKIKKSDKKCILDEIFEGGDINIFRKVKRERNRRASCDSTDDKDDNFDRLNVYITKEGIKSNDKFIKIYDSEINKRYIICQNILLVFYNKTVDIFIYNFDDITVQTFNFSKFIRKVDLKRTLIKLEENENYLFFFEYGHNLVDFYKQINEGKIIRIFAKNNKIVRIIKKNYNFSEYSSHYHSHRKNYTYYFYELINLIYDSKKNNNMLIKICDYFDCGYVDFEIDNPKQLIEISDLLNEYKQSKNPPVVTN